MALETSLGACLVGCGTVPIKDITGLYNPISNLVGWGNPNILREDILEATLVLTFTNSKGTVTTNTIDITTEVQEADLSTIDLYTYETIGDGILEITYTVIGPEEEVYETATSLGIYCNVECCVDKLALKAAKTPCNPCDKTYPTVFDVASSLLSALPRISVCLNPTEYFTALAQLEKLCGTNCGCGCS
jgi:hypothetical protein